MGRISERLYKMDEVGDYVKDRIGEKNYNSFGSKMIIKEYRGSLDIDVYFPEYDWVCINTRYDCFKVGKLSCPYEKRFYDIGYLGEGEYKYSYKGKRTLASKYWLGVLGRCYDPKYKIKHPSYEDATCCEEWHNLQNFAKWYEENYYEIEGEEMQLDKDILCKGNKIYSPDTCVFVPQRINKLFTKRQNCRGQLPIGVRYSKDKKKYVSRVRNHGEIYLGTYDTIEEAFNRYKIEKEIIIKNVAEEYKNKIPNNLYNALINYKVEIND